MLVPAALAGPIVDRAAQSLDGDPVYVDPAATPTLTPSEESALESEIADNGDGPIYVAVLPAAAKDEVGGNATDVVGALAQRVGRARRLRRRGRRAVPRAGDRRQRARGRAGGQRSRRPRSRAPRSDGLAATLDDFVDRVGDARNGGSGATRRRRRRRRLPVDLGAGRGGGSRCSSACGSAAARRARSSSPR